MSLAVRRGLLVLVGVMLLQSAWILAVPPFRGSDEFDHAFRAAGVATGQWHLSEQASNGRGQLVRVPEDLAHAASAQCSSLPYTGPDNCTPVEVRNGRALIATAAGPYDPVFYAVIGKVAQPFHGSSALYVMRIITALLCALLLALGAGLMTRAGSGPWTTLGLVAALMPEVIYSSVIAAPDGPEMALGLVMWGGLLAANGPNGPARSSWPLALAGVAATLLTFTRQLGPLWIAVIVCSAVAFHGVTASRRVIKERRGPIVISVLSVFLGGCWWALWQVIASQVHQPAHLVQQSEETHRWILAFNLPAWILQMIGAFPYRDQPAPLWIYPLALLVIGLFCVGAYRVSKDTRERRVVSGVVLASLLIPVGASLVLMPSYGAIWQGRYELPFVIGILPLCGLLLDRHTFAPVEGRRLTVLSLGFLLVCHLVSVVSVMHTELGRTVSTRDSGWIHPPIAVVGLLAIAGFVVVARTAWRPREAEESNDA
jgi:hypothetical protein